MISSTKFVVKKLKSFIDLTDNEISTFSSLPQRLITLSAGREIVHEGLRAHNAFILLDGWVASYKLLRSLLLRTSDHSFEAITEITVAEISAQNMISTFAKSPRLASAILWAASRDEAMVVEHLVNIGRRSAIVRTAHFLLELGTRLNLIGVGTPNSYPCPLSQYLLADALGLSAIHINRVLRQLREQDLMTFQKGIVHFKNLEKLIALADFQVGYLDQDEPIIRH